MCWVTREKRHMHPKIAKRNIKVFKVVRHHNYFHKPEFGIPLYYSNAIHYYIGKTYTMKKPISVLPAPFNVGISFRIHEGYHSYSPKDAVIEYGSNGTTFKVVYTKTYGTLDCRKISPVSVYAVMDCFIPKGTRYFKNEYGEYVSERLTVIGFTHIETPERSNY